jgi:hypothetical protein
MNLESAIAYSNTNDFFFAGNTNDDCTCTKRPKHILLAHWNLLRWPKDIPLQNNPIVTPMFICSLFCPVCLFCLMAAKLLMLRCLVKPLYEIRDTDISNCGVNGCEKSELYFTTRKWYLILRYIMPKNLSWDLIYAPRSKKQETILMKSIVNN